MRAASRRAPWCRAVATAVVVALATLAVPAVGSASPAAAAGPVTPHLTDRFGLRVRSARQVDPRLLDVTVTTAALPEPADVDVLLPTGYAAHPDRRYPVLYLLTGTSGRASNWVDLGDAERTTAGLPLIVVMPDITLDGDGGGWCTDWVNGGAYGPPEWETFHIDELIPWVDANFRTVADRGGRAIAGLSQGGFCSMSYAAQFPDLFVAALSFSGAPDISYDPVAFAGARTIINATEVALDKVPANSMFGDPETDRVNWAAHDPTTLAGNLRGVDLYLYSGNGRPGPLDPDPPGAAETIESLVDLDTALFHQRLVALGIPSTWDDYGPGTHEWPYWARDLQWSIGAVMADFAHPPPPPAAVTYTSAAPTYGDFGWQVTVHRPAEEFSTLADADAAGFRLSGSGWATVGTPPVYRPGDAYQVEEQQGPATPQRTVVTADAHGALHLTVPLGPANPYPEYSPAAAQAGTRVYTTAVHLAPAGGR